MDKEKELPTRKDIRLKRYDYSSPGVYFVTICTEKRKNYFWNKTQSPKDVEWYSVGANTVRPYEVVCIPAYNKHPVLFIMFNYSLKF